MTPVSVAQPVRILRNFAETYGLSDGHCPSCAAYAL